FAENLDGRLVAAVESKHFPAIQLCPVRAVEIALNQVLLRLPEARLDLAQGVKMAILSFSVGCITMSRDRAARHFFDHAAEKFGAIIEKFLQRLDAVQVS